jgi:hypothetical protein
MGTDKLEAAMCIWEAVLEIRDRPDVKRAFEALGTNEVRHMAMGWVDACERDWQLVQEDYELSYDWDFVPAWIEKNVDWGSPR